MEDDFLKGGAHELSGVLERRTKEDPERFAKLALRFPDDTHRYYFDAVLRGIAEADVSTETLLEVCRRCHELPERPSGRWICDAVEKAAERTLPEELLKIVHGMPRKTRTLSESCGAPTPGAGNHTTAEIFSQPGSALLEVVPPRR